MELNPYASFLASQDARAVLAATPGLLHQACCELTPEEIDSPIALNADGSGKWSPRQIAAHLADVELVFGFRLRQALAGGADGSVPVIQPFDQDVWARHYEGYDLPASLETYKAVRGWNLELIGGLAAAEFARPIMHPERGHMTFQTIVETLAGHDLNHLTQVQNLAEL